jgi:CheY-like chemotaxis protein
MTIPILVVDDYPLVAATIAALLRAEGFQAVDVAHDGPNALEKLGQKQYRVVISDLSMPRMNGLQLFAAVRESDSFQGTRFVMVTGHKDSAEIEAAERVGVDAVLVKPLSSEALSDLIHGFFVSETHAA